MTERKSDRDTRLKAALRDNLRKRKLQERGVQQRGGERVDAESADLPETDGSAPAQR